MNLLASSRDDPRVMFVVIVNDDKILVYRFSTLTPSALPALVDRISDPRSVDEDSMDRTINVMQVGYLGTEEVLVTGNEAGEVVTESAWGIAIHAERRLVGISTNAHTVTVFHCGTNSRISPRHYPTSHTTTASAAATDAASSSRPDLWSATSEPSTSQQILAGHGHNIPCVTFSPCGRFVATASVDRTCRTWRLSDGHQIQQKGLDPLWGWGVRFVPEESWMTITRAEYRRIPKDHLRPGKHPGLNVRDSPFSATTFTQRRLPPGRDLRMIRTRWYAGPIHEDRARRRGGYHGEGGSLSRRSGGTGQDDEENEETDDRDAALFGMDDDEDEWEDASSSGTDELGGQGGHNDSTLQQQPSARSRTNRQDIGSGSSTNRSPTSNSRPGIPRLSSIEVSVDTGDDGDNEGTGVDTEDAAGTAGESSSASRTTGRERKLERRSLLSMKALETQKNSRDHGESSSEQEQTTSVVPETRSEAIPHGPSHVEAEPPAEFQPIVISTFLNGGPFANLVRVTPFQSVKTSGTPTSPVTPATPPQPPSEPEFPKELLLCQTARNIYLLGRYPLVSEGEVLQEELQTSASALMPYATEVTSITLLDDEEDDEGEIVLTGDASINGEEEEDSAGDDSSSASTDHHYHQYTFFGPSYDDDSVDSDDSESEPNDDDDDDEPRSGIDPEHGSRISMLHTLTVARSAATRADGRRYHHLEHFDRLFVMELVPELSILVAASQKGTITVFRLLRVLDDPVASGPVPAAEAGVEGEEVTTSTSVASVSSQSLDQNTTIHRHKRHKGKDASGQGKNDKDVITIKGENYVLFPEMYLPRLEPSHLPLYGVSVVPLQYATPASGGSRKHNIGGVSQLPRSGPSTSPSSTPTLFILHLMYMDSQLFSYELRLRNDKDDPVRLGNIFV
ncbi:hypothetical protein EC991_001502 [Linnemannia zychae]|nr:hypothetical protein EC991_001502 [Linnemannia zychae]